MKVRLRNPDRDVDLAAGRTVHEILDELGIDANAVRVIRAGELVTREVRVEDADELEIRPVVSGGARDRAVAATGIRRGYLERGAPLFAVSDDAEVGSCESCGQPTTGRFCAFCRARAQILGRRLGPPDGGDRDLVRELSDEGLPVEIYGEAR